MEEERVLIWEKIVHPEMFGVKVETKWKLSMNLSVFTSLVDNFRKSGDMQDMLEFAKSKYAQAMIGMVSTISEGKISDVVKFLMDYEKK